MLVVDMVEVGAPMIPRKNLKKLKDLLLPQNHDGSAKINSLV